MVIKNKRGWIRIFEAVIAVLLILSALLLIYKSQQVVPQESKYVQDWQVEILARIAENDELRNATINKETTPLNNFIEEMLLPNLNFTLKICNLTGPCSMEFYVERNIYVQERIISGTLEEYSPKKIRFFVWRIEE